MRISGQWPALRRGPRRGGGDKSAAAVGGPRSRPDLDEGNRRRNQEGAPKAIPMKIVLDMNYPNTTKSSVVPSSGSGSTR